MAETPIDAVNKRPAERATFQITDLASTIDPLVVGLAQEMASRWDQGECPLVEEFLDRHQELYERPESAVRLVYEEICLRQEKGEEGASLVVVSRFPQWRTFLEQYLSRPASAGAALASHFPVVGDTFGDFRLIGELGEGRWGRVFLATQPTLADRPVVLKLTPCGGQEHLSLARLQHTHIVPIYSVADDPKRNLRTLCTPYFGGATLTHVLRALHDQPLGRRTGQELLSVLDQAQAAAPVAMPLKGPARQWIAVASYSQAICLIGKSIAEALHYAHERGLIHLDVKSSNVLLAADGQPMLLDFHLAQEPVVPGRPTPRWLGGTPAYMSPEQKAAMAAVRQRRSIQLAVDGRSDIYSLGLMLYEALGGTLPLPPEQVPPPLEKRNPQVTAGLDNILRKCLAQDPRQRYPTGMALAADLGRHLTNQPLEGVADDLRERWRKWRRRKPQQLLIIGMQLAMVVIILATGAFVLFHFSQRRNDARAALVEAEEHLQKNHYEEGLHSISRGLAVLDGVPFSYDLSQQLESRRHQLLLRQQEAKGAEAAEQMHVVADRLRLNYGLEFFPADALKAHAGECQKIWDQRSLILERLGTELDPAMKQRIRTDFLDLAILWADLRVRLATENPKRPPPRADLQAALDLLAEAESRFGSSIVLYSERRVYAEMLGHKESTHGPPPPPRNAWEHYALGRFFLRSQDLPAVERQARADEEFRTAIALQPDSLWPYYYHGMCAFRLRRYQEAETAFTVCGALSPQVPQWFYDLGMARAALHQTDEALHAYDFALKLNPGLADAALNRGILYYQQGQDQDAIADFLLARARGADPATVYHNLAVVYRDPGTDLASKWLIAWLTPQALHIGHRHASGH